ncbi:hypothetical protein [Microbulbifer hydrolyticus]|uniref:DUF4175 family protein n=1 Tax=Microbulbifer hydrolyticus TaxID=48074 RepID=A0A6P1TFW1_9GAMM|nr:hypothetical protein [Microbulbifer hydrolyticus]MBB5211871.1 hypothetical protein [Microbulbifer hydrolyticus]QHQ40543.1 hypothetical protein GTQ55_17205 [Microbulbifer hydrolyticus]
MSNARHTRSQRILQRAGRRWYIHGLMPYVLVALLLGISAWLSRHFLLLPQWILAVAFVPVVLATALDRYWRPSQRELCTKLDARYPALQDSCHLLIAGHSNPGPVMRVQQQRVAKALQQLQENGSLQTFRPDWRRRPLLYATGAAIILLLVPVAIQLSGKTATTAIDRHAQPTRPVQAQPSVFRDIATYIQPPDYTGIAPYPGALAIEATENSRVTWNITLEAPADGLHMLAAEESFAFTPRDPAPSRRWQLTRTLSASDFYQLAISPDAAIGKGGTQMLLPELHNIEITPDRPPAFVFEYPQDNVTIVTRQPDAESPLLTVSVTVEDDFQVVETDLLVTLASGSGENVRFRDERIRLEAESTEGKKRRYRFSIPVHRYQIEPGDELYWHLEARDNRAPKVNIQKSQHFILRWPQEEIFGLSDSEGMAIKILPEYFRSQRQLIIDTEALLADRENISQQEFRKRSESLAYEQNLLRMRYGRFLGEEDSAMEHGGETHATDHHGESEEHHDKDTHEQASEHSGHGNHHGDDGNEGEKVQQFGDASGVIAAAGHAHDSSEHATLFDPETKELLRSALNAMWSAWRDLSVVEPRASLPHQHTALRHIKQVQQASRIYLQRVGFETPALDESRRLSGEHDQTAPPQVDSAREDAEREQLLALFKRVQQGEALDPQATSGLRQLQVLRGDDTLQMSLAKHLRRYRQQPGCRECRQQLSAFLYALLPAPAAHPTLPLDRRASGTYSNWLQESAAEARQ